MAEPTYFSATQRPSLFVLATCLFAISFSGCRNCRQPCAPQPYTPYNTAPAYGYGYNNVNAGLSGNTQARIPAPPTYSLNIPGGNANANGYRVGQLPNGLLNTQQTAPTPANRPANYNQQQGWRRSDGTNLNTSSTDQPSGSNRFANASTGSSVLESSARINHQNNGSGTRTASSSNADGGVAATGVSFTQSTDYQSTSTDERLDNTRLPVTDATNVRATSPFAQNQSGSSQYVQPYYQPNQPRYASLPPTTYNQGAFVRPNYGPLPPTQTYQGSFHQRFNTPAAQPQQQVLAQSTARFDPFQASASTASSDWRDRGRESRSY